MLDSALIRGNATDVYNIISIGRFARLERTIPVGWFWNRQEVTRKYPYRFQIHDMEIQTIISVQLQLDLKIANFEYLCLAPRVLGYVPISNNFPSFILDSSITRVVRETS